tara:strand:- start:327 stop:1058 length:732 start_codon:yes stop_codon:yes gene_type:complete
MPKHGHGDIVSEYTYPQVIESLFDQVKPDVFQNRVLHLKSRAQEADKAEEIKKYCASQDIRVIETKGDLIHHSKNPLSHAAGYYKDIYKAYSDIKLRKTKYSLWLEDDFIFKCSDGSLHDSFVNSIDFLNENPDQMCVRYNQSNHDTVAAEDYKKRGHTKVNENIFCQDTDYTEWGATFTFQPNINRTAEIFCAWKAGQAYLNNLHQIHCELLSGELLKHFTNNPTTPFNFYNPEKVYSEHIG